MFQEALASVQRGERARAKDLLTRLLKINQDSPTYWLWMSTVVDSPRERAYCLNEVLKRDPENVEARRGLLVLGLGPVDERSVLPFKQQKRAWQTELGGETSEAAARNILVQSWRQIAIVLFGLALLAGLVVVVVIGTRRIPSVFTGPITDLTPKPSATFIATGSPFYRSPTPTFVGPTPLWMQMKATYTPTALYINTPHAVSESYRIGIRALQRGNYADLFTYMEQAATAEPEAPDLFYYLGEARRLSGKPDQAINFYNQSMRVSPGFAPAYAGRALARLAANPAEIGPIVADLQKALELDPGYGEAALRLADLFLKDGDPDSALTALNKAALALPGSPLVPLLRGRALLAQGDPAGALEQARAAAKLDFTLLPAYRFLGEALQANDLMAGSIEPLRTYLLYVTDDAGAELMLARALLAGGDRPGALKAFSQALTLNRSDLQALLERGRLYIDLKEYDSAVSDFQRAIELDKTSFVAHIGLGEAYYRLDSPGDAYMEFERAKGLAQNDKEHAAALYWRGRSLDDLNKRDIAIEDYRGLLALPPGAAPADWLAFARSRLATLVPPTATPSATPTATRPAPTVTRTPRPPTVTPRPSPSPSPTR